MQSHSPMGLMLMRSTCLVAISLSKFVSTGGRKRKCVIKWLQRKHRRCQADQLRLAHMELQLLRTDTRRADEGRRCKRSRNCE